MSSPEYGTWQYVMGKAMSGRFIATVTACALWFILAYRDRISQEFNATMLVRIFNWYFKRKKDEEDER